MIAGYDQTGSRLFRTCPSGMYYEYISYAIGSRCQTANTYLENHMDEYENASLDDLIKHAIGAMKKAQDISVTKRNLDILIVGKDTPLKVLNEDEIERYLNTGIVLD